ncbi:MAG: FecR domain-containing protein [Deltaproteobacteria bacterium]|nr:FecR domain-containing protein [Deltaproteobacteria bacterium]
MKIHAKIAWAAAVFALLFILSAGASMAAIGDIQAQSGAVYFKAKGAAAWGLAPKGGKVDVGDRIKTGSDGRALLVLKDKSRLMLGNDTEIEVSEFLLTKKERSAVYSVSTGKVRAIVAKFSGRSDIKVRTQTGVAGVKGTDFIVMNQGAANVYFGKESRVDVSGEGADGTVKLVANKMTENTSGAAPIEPVNVEPGSPLEEARAQLEAVTDVAAPVEWEKTGNLPNLLARWNINYGRYLAESRRYKEALDVFHIAVDLTAISTIQAEAHLEMGTVYALYMNDPRSALVEYNTVIEKYPELPFVANALYSAGKINMDIGNKAEAGRLFRRYLDEYPQGRHRETVEQLLRSLAE